MGGSAGLRRRSSSPTGSAEGLGPQAGGAVRRADVRAVYPYRSLPEVLPARIDVYAALRDAAAAELLARVSGVATARYHVTALGAAVMRALPDRHHVGTPRGRG
jgi:hypothetical protein